MTLLLIGFGGGAVIGFVLCAIRAGQQFDEGYRMGMEVGQSPKPVDATCGEWSWSFTTTAICDDPADHGPRWYVRPPDGDWLPTTEAVARSVEEDGWRVAEVKE